jgi:hypothetical protein
MSSRGLSNFRKRLSGRRNGHKEDGKDVPPPPITDPPSSHEIMGSPPSPNSPRRRMGRSESPSQSPHRSNNNSSNNNSTRSSSTSRSGRRGNSVPAVQEGNPDATTTTTSTERGRESRPNVFQRIRERSRSRSRSRGRSAHTTGDHKELLVAVTSCRSDGYYNQKAPGSTSKLPRKAPTNLKLFHELAVGVKDAYAAVGATPRKPTDDDPIEEREGKTVLWDFVGNVDFVSRNTLQ